jgi:probable phosphoglycerate mutase
MYTSPLGRAMQTSAIITPYLKEYAITASSSLLLKECDYGQWQGLTKQEVAQQFPDAVARRNADKWNYRIPAGESYADLSVRATDFMTGLSDDSEDDVILIVAHEMLNRAMRGVLLNLPPEKILGFQQANNKIIRVIAGEEKHFVVD